MEQQSKIFNYKQVSWKEYLYDKKAGTVLGRTSTGWLKLTVFYIIFYGAIGAFFAAMLTAYLFSIEGSTLPKYIPGDGGSLLRNPALAFRPTPQNTDSILVWYKMSDPETFLPLVGSINELIKPYERTENITGVHLKTCSDENSASGDEVCVFQHSWLHGECNKNDNWGYGSGRPCVIIKLNKMIGWVPDVYEAMDELPQEMPDELKQYIHNATNDNNGVMPKMLWVSCDGEYPADKEYIGPVKYSPWHGFPVYFFPYMNHQGYMSPILAVQFLNPRPNVLINIVCKVWVKNVQHHIRRRIGLVHMQFIHD